MVPGAKWVGCTQQRDGIAEHIAAASNVTITTSVSNRPSK